jgi:hypothetical protein
MVQRVASNVRVIYDLESAYLDLYECLDAVQRLLAEGVCWGMSISEESNPFCFTS